MPVLEPDAVSAHAERNRTTAQIGLLDVGDVDAARGDGIYLGSTRRRDVDAGVKAERPWAGDVRVGHARVGEVAADRMRLIERLQRPPVRSSVHRLSPARAGAEQ